MEQFKKWVSDRYEATKKITTDYRVTFNILDEKIENLNSDKAHADEYIHIYNTYSSKLQKYSFYTNREEVLSRIMTFAGFSGSDENLLNLLQLDRIEFENELKHEISSDLMSPDNDYTLPNYTLSIQRKQIILEELELAIEILESNIKSKKE